MIKSEVVHEVVLEANNSATCFVRVDQEWIKNVGGIIAAHFCRTIAAGCLLVQVENSEILLFRSLRCHCIENVCTVALLPST